MNKSMITGIAYQVIVPKDKKVPPALELGLMLTDEASESNKHVIIIEREQVAQLQEILREAKRLIDKESNGRIILMGAGKSPIIVPSKLK